MLEGEILVDGNEPPARTGREMCEYIVAAGLWQGTPESLWNYSSTGELSVVFDLYYMALAKNGHKLEVVMPDGSRFAWPLWGSAAEEYRKKYETRRPDNAGAGQPPATAGGGSEEQEHQRDLDLQRQDP